jgi:hypothetical protein
MLLDGEWARVEWVTTYGPVRADAHPGAADGEDKQLRDELENKAMRHQYYYNEFPISAF